MAKLRILGLDVGDKTIGVALSDPLGWTAQGLEVRQRSSLEEDLEYVRGLVEEYGVGRIIVGLPLNMNGTAGPQADKVTDFIEQLRKYCCVPVEPWDERLTTHEAERTLLEADLSRAKRKRVIDKVAAQVILQSYLNAISSKETGLHEDNNGETSVSG